jgi:hypothetical protein
VSTITIELSSYSLHFIYSKYITLLYMSKTSIKVHFGSCGIYINIALDTISEGEEK